MSVAAFFADDFVTAVIAIVWIALLYGVSRFISLGPLGAPLLVAGVIGSLVVGVRRKIRAK